MLAYIERIHMPLPLAAQNTMSFAMRDQVALIGSMLHEAKMNAVHGSTEDRNASICYTRVSLGGSVESLHRRIAEDMPERTIANLCIPDAGRSLREGGGSDAGVKSIMLAVAGPGWESTLPYAAYVLGVAGMAPQGTVIVSCMGRSCTGSLAEGIRRGKVPLLWSSDSSMGSSAMLASSSLSVSQDGIGVHGCGDAAMARFEADELAYAIANDMWALWPKTTRGGIYADDMPVWLFMKWLERSSSGRLSLPDGHGIDPWFAQAQVGKSLAREYDVRIEHGGSMEGTLGYRGEVAELIGKVRVLIDSYDSALKGTPADGGRVYGVKKSGLLAEGVSCLYIPRDAGAGADPDSPSYRRRILSAAMSELERIKADAAKLGIVELLDAAIGPVPEAKPKPEIELAQPGAFHAMEEILRYDDTEYGLND
jgi:hypothetical protein